MSIVLYDDGTHQCVKFDDLIGKDEIQANQFLISHDKKGILLDPGGNKLFSTLSLEMVKYCPPQRLEKIILSHQDPDVGAGLNGWLLMTDASIMVSQLWTRFIPNFCTRTLTDDRLIAIPDQGMKVDLGGSEIVIVPAHFLHSPGNFHVYDSVSKILFTSDMGVSVGYENENIETEEQFDNHIQFMAGFHKRYMPHGSACRAWADMVRGLDIEMIVPQHGARFSGKVAVNRFLEWATGLECALDDPGELFRLP